MPRSPEDTDVKQVGAEGSGQEGGGVAPATCGVLGLGHDDSEAHPGLLPAFLILLHRFGDLVMGRREMIVKRKEAKEQKAGFV